ncbi:MAG: hypothetical protein ABIZ91_06685 [Gemmatimonadaceae bacterium]
MRTNFRLMAVALALVAVACGGDKVPPIPDSLDVSNTTNVGTAGVRPAAADSDSVVVRDNAPAGIAADQVGEFRAAGNEPFWSVVINSQSLTLKTPQELNGVMFPATLPSVSRDSYHWKAETAQPNRHTIEVTIVTKSCNDSMADKKWTHTATIVYDGRTMPGCAEGGMPFNSSSLDARQKQ